MSEESDKRVDAVDDDAALASIIKLAGERPDIPLAVESRVYHRVEEEWRNATVSQNSDEVYRKVRSSWRRGNLMRWILPAGVAATAVIATVFMSQPDPVAVRVAATVSTVVGAEQFGAKYASGAEIHAGDMISTGEGEGLSLLLARNESLRIDENTELRVDAADQYTLLRGRVYADTGQFIYRNGGLKIDTPLGLVTDVGTQFSVTARGESLDVAVREGRVDVQTATDVHAARVGERLLLAPGEGATVTDLDTHDDYWDWIVDLTPAFDLTNRSLLDFLKWAARETGRELIFISDESRMSAMRTDVHGSVSGLTPEEALQAILATTTVRYRIERDKIVIES